jgi:hypothetical protein
MTSVTFGLISSPFQAIYVVREHSNLHKEEYPLAQSSIANQMYMDDIPDGQMTKSKAKKNVTELFNLLNKASMMTHKFASNADELLESIPPEAVSPDSTIKILGVEWDTKQDTLNYNIIDKILPTELDTKRSFLSQSGKIFDPLGLVSPITTRIKILFQKLWHPNLKLNWDVVLPNDLQNEWNQLKQDLTDIPTIKDTRCFFDIKKGKPKAIDLFAFGDASIKAYATAIYIRATYVDNSRTSTLVLSKTRVTPLKMVDDTITTQTIVRLELLAMLITARAAYYVKNALTTKINIQNVYCFSDSLINIHRVKNGPDKYKVWVGNRIKEILTLTNKQDWHHCPGIDNPADLPSRGLTAKELVESSLWWNGPSFITGDKEHWPKTKQIDISVRDNEIKVSQNSLVTTVSTPEGSEKMLTKILDRFSSWEKTIKMLAFVLRFGKKSNRKFHNKDFTVEEKLETENFLWRISQKIGFPTETKQLSMGKDIDKKSKIVQYNPEWDIEKALIISNSRLSDSNLPESTRRPIILPKNCRIVAKYVEHLHLANHHAGPDYVLSVLREKFRLQQARRQIRKIIRTCTKAKCTKPTPLTQQMAPLPSSRTDGNGIPFQHVSVDLFGPMYTKHMCDLENCPHEQKTKVYCALFTCFQTRAIHLELINNQGTEEFLTALRKFVGRRGRPDMIFSDNATNFKSGAKEIRLLYKSINWKAITANGIEQKIEWLFNTEKAPFRNGIAERMVRSVKTPLRIILGSACLTFRQLEVLLIEVESIVNNRPLALVTDDPDDLTPITPFELINGRKLDQMPDPNQQRNVTTFPHLWRKRQAVLNSFWKRWKKDYLLSQNLRKKWNTPSNQDLLGRCVLINDDSMSRNTWKMGRIIETYPSKDGLIRTVLVKTSTSKLRRPIQKLSLLEAIF